VQSKTDELTATSADKTFNTTSLVISNVACTADNRSATITWTTDDPATSQVEYGTTAAYGVETTATTALVTSHSVTISALAPETMYHYRVLSDSATDDATSADATFVTDAPVTLNIGVLLMPTTNNPFAARMGEADGSHIGIMYEPLIHYSDNDEVLPSLAESWAYDEPTTTWTFNLDPDAAWSDGMPVTALDVKFSYEKTWELDLSQGDDTVELVESITIPDSKTVMFRLSQTVGAFARLLSDVVIVPEHIWGDMTNEQILAYVNDNPVGSGA